MAGKTVLVIDADTETEQIIASTLESEGYLVFAVPGGDIGAEMAQKVKPSLIFVCPEDTGEEGMEVCRTILSYESMKSVPIVLLISGRESVDPGSCGAVDFLRLPLSAAELIEKTERAIAAKAPLVLRVKEKPPAPEETGEPAEEAFSPEVPGDAGVRSRLLDLAEIAGMETEEAPSSAQRGWGEDVEPYMPEDEVAGRKSNKLPVALLAILVIVAGAAAALYFSGLMPGMEQEARVRPPLQTAVKPKAPEPAPTGELQKQQAGEEQTARAPAAVAPAPPVKSAAPSSPPAASMTAKPSGKKVYSVQVGAFKSEKNADALAKHLHEKGYDTFSVKRSAKDGGTIYRVLVGRLDDWSESRKLASAIREKEKITAVIVAE